MRVTSEHLNVLGQVRNGADVYGYQEARLLRQCEKAGLVRICEPQGDVPGNEQQPYFGCIILRKGLELLSA